MLSSNTTTAWHGAVFYDAEFRRIGSQGNALSALNRSQGFTNDMDQAEATYVPIAPMFHNINPNTQTANSSTAHVNPMGGTASMGEYGQQCAFASERGVVVSAIQRTAGAIVGSTNNASLFNNRAFVNSDHQDKKLTMQLAGGYLTVSPLATPNCYNTITNATYRRPFFNVAPLFSAYDGGSTANLMYGSASYNNVRKELMVATYSSAAAGRFLIAIWKNFDFDAVNGDITTLTAAPTVLRTVSMPSWTDSSEARYNSKWTLVDDGSIFMSAFCEGSNFTKMFKITRNVDDSTFTGTFQQQQTNTTSYGIGQGEPYGQRQMQTRDGSMTVNWCVYYYYQCGIRSWVVDKRNSSYAIGHSSNNGSMGTYPVKYKNSGFAYYEGGNVYAGNYSGAYIAAYSSRGVAAGSAPVTAISTMYLPIFTGPNTTNYPGFTHVIEFDLQSELPY
jgi:hypothetical protein